MNVAEIRPTLEQIEWADCEIGVIIHLDLVIYQPPYNVRQHFYNPIPSSVFNPKKLNTDQWISAAKSLGAKYAVLVAKHCTGFSLWPTEAHDYSIKNSPYKNGNGDIVKDFIASCEKYGLRPGIYCSASFNQYYGVENPGRVIDGDRKKQEEYNAIVLKQLTELWSNYGKLFEIWFDGGVMPVSEGGPDIASLLKELQPDAVTFQGPVGTKSLIRWVGNERGVAPEDCSSLYDNRSQHEGGTVEHDTVCENAEIWCPAESDFPNRYARQSYLGGWFWREGEESSIVPADQLFANYLTSVGRNTNMLVGMVITPDGEFPESDATVFAEAGKKIRETFATPIATSSTGTVTIPANTVSPKYIVLKEDISQGERVTGYTVRAYDACGEEIFIHSGKVIAHKRILSIPAETVKVILEITSCRAEPKLLPIEIY